MFKKILFVLLFCTLFFTARAPEYSTPLYGEDGIFADIFINNPPRFKYGQTARINGETNYGRLIHPSPLYEWMAISGKFFTSVFPIKKAAEENSQKLHQYMRFSFSCFQFIAWIFLLAYLLTLPKEKSKWSDRVLFLALALSPPAIIYSLWIQVDNASGSIIAGVLMSSVLIWQRYKEKPLTFLAPALFIAGFVSGLGKNEWSILIFLAILATSASLFFIKKKNPNDYQNDFSKIVFLFIGLLAGNLFSYLFNPADYLAGFGLMNDMSQQSTILNTSQAQSWWKVTKIRMPILYLSLALWLYMSSLLVVKKPWKISPPTILGFFISSAFLWSFFLSSWDSTERYFIPAFISLVYMVMLIRTSYEQLDLGRYTYVFVLFLAIATTNYYVSSLKRHKSRVANYSEYLKSFPTKQGCVHHINYYAFNLKIDYIAIGNGPESLNNTLRIHNKKLCESLH